MSQLKKDEHLFISFWGENSQFTRFNKAKVRQSGVVKDAEVALKFIFNGKIASRAFSFTEDHEANLKEASETLAFLRKECAQLPVDEFAILPQNLGSSESEFKGSLLPLESSIENLVRPFGNSVDMVGFYQAGPVYRGNTNSAGQKHWFSTEVFSFVFSIVGANERAVKTSYAGTNWNQTEFESKVQESIKKLRQMEREPKKLERGKYRAYLSPAALNEVIGLLSWGGLGEASYRQGSSGLRHLKAEKKLSPKFNLKEDFSMGTVPKFNSIGEVAPEQVPLIENGILKTFLVSTRSSKEYGVPSNCADSTEGPRAPVIGKGTLKESDILKKLGTGVYLSNLHYLNWSDRIGGRVTGMTRFACFWVENGEIQAPIENMRFDVSLYDLFGENLEELTEFQDLCATTDTYYKRDIGGLLSPGALVKDFSFTL
jgi:predicted Zn-dependent protease